MSRNQIQAMKTNATYIFSIELNLNLVVVLSLPLSKTFFSNSLLRLQVPTEAVTWRFSINLLKHLQNSQKKNSVGASFLMTLQIYQKRNSGTGISH